MGSKVENEAMQRIENKLDDIETFLLKVTGQLAALQQANDTLVAKWRAYAKQFADGMPIEVGYASGKNTAADELEAATKEATA